MGSKYSSFLSCRIELDSLKHKKLKYAGEASTDIPPENLTTISDTVNLLIKTEILKLLNLL